MSCQCMRQDMDFDYNNYYSNISPIYNDIRLDSKINFEMTLDVILNAYPQKGLLLDIGCGTGKYGEALDQLGFTVTGIDKSPSQIQESEKLINSQLGDACQLPFGDNTFDVCTMISMIQQLNEHERIRAFKEVYRVLKPNGLLIIKTASHEDLTYKVSSIFFPETLSIDRKRYPTIQKLQTELNYYKAVTVKPVIITIEFEPAKLAQKIEKRRTTNLGMLTDQQLQVGLNHFKAYYNNVLFATKESHYTFIIARK